MSRRRGRGNRYTQGLYQLAKAVNSTRVVREVLEALVQGAAQALGARGCSLLLLSPNHDELLHIAAYGISDVYLRKGPVRVDETISDVLAGQVVAVEDALSDPRVQYPEAARREGIRSFLSIPLRLRDEVIGLLRLYEGSARTFSPEDVEFLSAVADLGAVALENAKAYEALRAEFARTREDLLEWYAYRSAAREAQQRPVRFAHPSEEEFARLLDFYKIRWEYEPRSFALEWDGERPVSLLTPDFYLPDLDLYIELTTLKQNLVTRKNHKLRRFRELYPQLNIRLLYRRDYHRLLAKYGYTPLEGEVGEVGPVVFSAAEIQKRVAVLGRQISEDYASSPPVLVGVLKGVACFMIDLMRAISLPIEVDFMALSLFEAREHTEAVHIVKDVDLPIQGRHVLLVEDIIDTGMTLRYVLDHLRRREPASLEVCVLLDKRARRLADLPLRYVGFPAPDEFLIGYGLDYRQLYRNLPFIAALATTPAAATKREP